MGSDMDLAMFTDHDELLEYMDANPAVLALVQARMDAEMRKGAELASYGIALKGAPDTFASTAIFNKLAFEDREKNRAENHYADVETFGQF